MTITYEIKKWHELSIEELHDMIKVRIDVFVVEQECPYPDLDGLDPKAVHVLAKKDNQIVGVSRLFAPGVKRSEAVLGRLCVEKGARGKGVAQKLIDMRIDYIKEHFPNSDIYSRIQTYRRQAYERMGFVSLSEKYMEDGIPHIDMVLKSKACNHNVA